MLTIIYQVSSIYIQNTQAEIFHHLANKQFFELLYVSKETSKAQPKGLTNSQKLKTWVVNTTAFGLALSAVLALTSDDLHLPDQICMKVHARFSSFCHPTQVE